MTTLLQSIFFVVSPLITLAAVVVAYIAVSRQSRPHVLVQYRPSPHVRTMIDLVIENLGGGLARNVKFSHPLPINYFGIDKPNGNGVDILGGGLPAIASGQQLIYTGGQYGGLSNKLKEPLEILITYDHRNPLGIKRKRSEICVLSLDHLQYMPSRSSVETVLIDALTGQNKTTLGQIQKDISSITKALNAIQKTSS